MVQPFLSYIRSRTDEQTPLCCFILGMQDDIHNYYTGETALMDAVDDDNQRNINKIVGIFF